MAVSGVPGRVEAGPRVEAPVGWPHQDVRLAPAMYDFIHSFEIVGARTISFIRGKKTHSHYSFFRLRMSESRGRNRIKMFDVGRRLAGRIRMSYSQKVTRTCHFTPPNKKQHSTLGPP